MRARILLLTALSVVALVGPAKAAGLHVLAAGSLREVMTEIGNRYRQATGSEIIADFGPSGLLRERIEKGEHADLFASADIGQPLRLQREGRAVRIVMFVRNTLCGVAVPRVGLTTANFIDRLLDPAVRLGTSTPKADPGGDYTWAMFHRIEALRSGSYQILDKKAQQIVGGPASNAPLGGEDPVVAALSRRAGRSRSSAIAAAPTGCAVAAAGIAGRRGAARDRDRTRIRPGCAQRRRPARRRPRAVHAVARGAADFRPLRLCSGGAARLRPLSAARTPLEVPEWTAISISNDSR